MADNIELPADPDAPELLGANEVDLRDDAVLVKIPLGGIVDAREDGTNRMAVLETGQLIAGARMFSRGFGFVDGIDSILPYDAGDVIGAGATLQEIPNGVYRVARLLATSAGSIDLPDGLRVVLIPFDPADPLDFGGDAEQYDPADARYLYSLVYDPAEYGTPSVAQADLTVEYVLIGQPALANGSFGTGPTFDLRVMVMTTTGSPAEPTEVGIAVSLVLEFVGPAPTSLDA